MSEEGNTEQPMPIKRVRTPKPTAEPRRRRTSGQAKTALAVIEHHLRGLYQQMEWLKAAVEELKSSL